MAIPDVNAVTKSEARPRTDEAALSFSKRRSRLPRFGLRSLFVVALLFCLLFAWIGRNLYRVRQEEAAIEALKQAGATIFLREDDVSKLHPAMSGPGAWGPTCASAA